MQQPVIVPVGRIALGRIFNVVGSVIDRYIELFFPSQFHTYIPAVVVSFISYSEDLTYTLNYRLLSIKLILDTRKIIQYMSNTTAQIYFTPLFHSFIQQMHSLLLYNLYTEHL